MAINPPSNGVLTRNATRVGPVTRAQVDVRARELALFAGRIPPHVAQTDYLQAKRELTGEADADLQDAILDARPEEKRGVPGPAGESQ